MNLNCMKNTECYRPNLIGYIRYCNLILINYQSFFLSWLSLHVTRPLWNGDKTKAVPQTSVEIGLGYPGQTCLFGSGWDWITTDAYGSTTMDATGTFVFREPHPRFAAIFVGCWYSESHTPYFMCD